MLSDLSPAGRGNLQRSKPWQSIAAPSPPFSSAASPRRSVVRPELQSRKCVLCGSRPELTVYGVDLDNAALVKRGSVSTPANIQYAWPHRRKRISMVSSNGGLGAN
jgi:hypothetical protein